MTKYNDTAPSGVPTPGPRPHCYECGDPWREIMGANGYPAWVPCPKHPNPKLIAYSPRAMRVPELLVDVPELHESLVALAALRLEVPEKVADDVIHKVHAAFWSLLRLRAVSEGEPQQEGRS